uniref:Uncharacterized protein n=1 Tax=Arundo donax TaxID=35708 RepID=A0A0A9FCB4_ARUDO
MRACSFRMCALVDLIDVSNSGSVLALLWFWRQAFSRTGFSEQWQLEMLETLSHGVAGELSLAGGWLMLGRTVSLGYSARV